ncbi:MAG: DNA polymerase III [Spirochaetaceae bacterium]|nr:DNA polymerase III [Spirochaetaceae bacterium]
MFENMIGQPVTARLQSDILNNVLAPSMLFEGPAASGKGTAALEIGRAFSCETEGAPWNCRCHACARHRSLSHEDLIVTGPRPFSQEISAACAALLRDTQAHSSRTLFMRAVRKLQLRFSPVLLADDPKITKFNSLLETISETMEELNFLYGSGGDDSDKRDKIAKLCDTALKQTQKLEAEGIADTIPVSHIRNAAYWLRIAPSGRRKLLLIENADRMQDAARNSLLKILEEPPETSAIILCTSKPKALLPTILSRLRHYSFAKRGAEADAEVVRRVFKDANDSIPLHGRGESGVTAYLDKFSPVPKNVLYPAAALFLSSTALAVSVRLRKKGVPAENLPPAITAIGKHCAPEAEAAGLGKACRGAKALCAAVLAAAGNFDKRGAFSVFLGLLCARLSEALLPLEADTVCAAYRKILSKSAEEARLAVDVFNQSPPLALERLFDSLTHEMAIV